MKSSQSLLKENTMRPHFQKALTMQNTIRPSYSTQKLDLIQKKNIQFCFNLLKMGDEHIDVDPPDEQELNLRDKMLNTLFMLSEIGAASFYEDESGLVAYR
jgi:hypothetical protein